jgi:hypothetical protein
VVKEINCDAGTYVYGIEFMADVKAFWGIHFPTSSSS